MLFLVQQILRILILRFCQLIVYNDQVVHERSSDCNWKKSTHAEPVILSCLDFKLSQLEVPIELCNCTNIVRANRRRMNLVVTNFIN